MPLTVQAGRLATASLEVWLNSFTFQQWVQSLAGNSAHALIEYVHRFAFVSWADLLQDLAEGEIGGFSLRGRIFWETGQVAWRRLEEDEFGLCLLLECDPCPCLPDDLLPAEEFLETLEPEADEALMLWGRYNAQRQVFLEQRVGGSRPIVYPAAIATVSKDYPVLEVRVYRNEDGEPSMWRFLEPTARSKADWPASLEEEAQ